MKRHNITLTENFTGSLLALPVLQAVSQHLSSRMVRIYDKQVFCPGMKEQSSPYPGVETPITQLGTWVPALVSLRYPRKASAPQAEGDTCHGESAGDPVLRSPTDWVVTAGVCVLIMGESTWWLHELFYGMFRGRTK